jgi:hypothetical protein
MTKAQIRKLQYEAAMAGKEYRHSTMIRCGASVVYGDDQC